MPVSLLSLIAWAISTSGFSASRPALTFAGIQLLIALFTRLLPAVTGDPALVVLPDSVAWLVSGPAIVLAWSVAGLELYQHHSEGARELFQSFHLHVVASALGAFSTVGVLVLLGAPAALVDTHLGLAERSVNGQLAPTQLEVTLKETPTVAPAPGSELAKATDQAGLGDEVAASLGTPGEALPDGSVKRLAEDVAAGKPLGEAVRGAATDAARDALGAPGEAGATPAATPTAPGTPAADASSAASSSAADAAKPAADDFSVAKAASEAATEAGLGAAAQVGQAPADGPPTWLKIGVVLVSTLLSAWLASVRARLVEAVDDLGQGWVLWLESGGILAAVALLPLLAPLMMALVVAAMIGSVALSGMIWGAAAALDRSRRQACPSCGALIRMEASRCPSCKAAVTPTITLGA